MKVRLLELEREGIFQDGDTYSLLFPFLPGGAFIDLMNLRDEDGKEIVFSSYECSYYIAQIVTAVRAFHMHFLENGDQSVTHFDVGPYNFLIDALGKLKVCPQFRFSFLVSCPLFSSPTSDLLSLTRRRRQ